STSSVRRTGRPSMTNSGTYGSWYTTSTALARSRRTIGSAGVSRWSAMSALYVTPTSSTVAPLSGLPCRLSTSPARSTTYAGLAGALGVHHLVAQLAVERRRGRRAADRMSPHDLRRVPQAERLVARVDALRRERQVEVHPGGQPGRLLQDRPDHLVGGPRVRR